MSLVDETIMAARMARCERILDAVADRHGVTTKEILGRSRTAPVAAARHVVEAELFQSGMACAEIGRILGRDHTSVQHGVQRVLGMEAYKAELASRRQSRGLAVPMADAAMPQVRVA
jgi:chromosomal replication initiation ATPase DnaA